MKHTTERTLQALATINNNGSCLGTPCIKCSFLNKSKNLCMLIPSVRNINPMNKQRLKSAKKYLDGLFATELLEL